eukprot:6179013-Pleurochrysis_carterae.AAC.1
MAALPSPAWCLHENGDRHLTISRAGAVKRLSEGSSECTIVRNAFWQLAPDLRERVSGATGRHQCETGHQSPKQALEKALPTYPSQSKVSNFRQVANRTHSKGTYFLSTLPNGSVHIGASVILTPDTRRTLRDLAAQPSRPALPIRANSSRLRTHSPLGRSTEWTSLLWPPRTMPAKRQAGFELGRRGVSFVSTHTSQCFQPKLCELI